MLPPSMNKGPKESMKEASVEANNDPSLNGGDSSVGVDIRSNANGNVDAATTTISSKDEKDDDVVMTDADVSTIPLNKDDRSSQPAQFQMPPGAPKSDEKMDTNQDLQHPNVIAMDTSFNHPAKTIIASQATETTTVAKTLVSVPERNGDKVNFTPEDLVGTTTTMKLSNKAESIDDESGTTENTTTNTQLSALPATKVAATAADIKASLSSSLLLKPKETTPNAAAHFLGSSSSASMTAKIQTEGLRVSDKKTVMTNTAGDFLPKSQSQPLRGPGFLLSGGRTLPTSEIADKSGDKHVTTATTNDTVANSLGGKAPSLPGAAARKITQQVPIQGITSKVLINSNDIGMAAKQTHFVGVNNQTINKVTTGSLFQKNSSSVGSTTPAKALKGPKISALNQFHQQSSASSNQAIASSSHHHHHQQQLISRSNSNDGVTCPPHGVMTGSIPKTIMNKTNAVSLSNGNLSSGGISIPGTCTNSINSNVIKNSMNNNANAQHASQPQSQPHPQPGFRPPQSGPFGPLGGMRELRVEDALLYLDDVKREFGGRPRVYNEFLAIMKNFKSQEVDTPGVIARVSKLFRGNNHLILGFNKFLPDGYKISMEDLRQMDLAHAREDEIRRQHHAAQQQHQFQQLEAQMNLPQQRLAGRQMQQQQQQQPSPSHIAGPSSQQLQQQQQSIRDVQMEQANRQRIQATADLQKQEQQRQQQAAPKLPKQSKQGGVKSGKGRKVHALPLHHQQQPPPQIPQQQLQQQQPPPPHHQQQQQQQPQQMQHQAVEFDHAISYVTTIKRRFANDQSTYHSFLEILHTYQKEQRGIKEVLEQVAHLFQDHPDLLKEFTFFLPDAVQEQAKERLHRAASESESRLSAQKEKKNKQLQGSSKEVIDMTEHPRPVDQSEPRGQKRYHSDMQDAPVLITYPQPPEAFVYNSAVERQFFDAAKEALASYTRDGGQAWAEFLKCLDMYAQEILSRSEMLNFVEPLLGKRNNKLFEEFKRILSAAGGQGTSTVPLMEDSWYSVPLSEIDFSRCRRCSPSYRALPRDYPAPPCSKRSDEEAKVLNDVWVSLPVGSEESYTFRHMRRNTYEETLFRVEDERFEIDMTIDSNLCTLALLEPIAEEMAQLSGNETLDKENESKLNQEQKGFGGKRYRYTFDPNILGVIHRNSITRIYGDAGPEMLDLMKNNPSVAIPVIVNRLKQKDTEWRRVRARLNRHWKELAENNYYKSLDHRSLTWRTTDKRAISNRTLLTEIKDRAANNGNESEAALQARVDKAKEEHGSFFEVTMGNAFLRKLDLSTLPKPDRRLFTPHMSLMYKNNNWVQRDAYRILSFALERGSISPTDKERCHRLWTEFLGPWFSLKLNWMLSPAVAFQDTSTSSSRLSYTINQDDNSLEDDEEESPDDDEARINARIVTEDARDVEHECDDDCDAPSHVDHHPLPAGSLVSTIYGEGRIICYRKQDNMYVIKLALGSGYLRPSAVLCSILEAEKSAYTTQRMTGDNTKLDRSEDKLMIGTQSLYLFFRLHQILCRRIGIAKKLAFEVKSDPSLQTLVEQMPGQSGAASGKRRYEAFLSLVYALLDGGTGTAAEGGKFEDRVRSLLGHGGYELATMDKLISHILKNIQNMANDDTMWSLVQLFRRHLDAGGFRPEAFRQEAAYLSDGEHMYAFQLCPIQKDKGDKSVLHVENLGVIVGSEDEDSTSEEPSYKRQRR